MKISKNTPLKKMYFRRDFINKDKIPFLIKLKEKSSL